LAGDKHVVVQGETLLSIATAHKFSSWEVIWDHPNNAELRERRGDPQVLAPGDELFIPAKDAKVHSVATDKRHTFVINTLMARFRTIVRDDKGEALANKRFELEIGTQATNGLTDGDGVVELEIPPRAQRGILRVFLDDEAGTTLTWNLRLGDLDPIDTLTGVKARLTNLGFICGPIDDRLDAATITALRDFQIVYRLPVTGRPDDDTRAKLLAVHDHR
jgi:N-acetylmuramoyl-L-alanine amidase